jgi:Uma2 family endonuclease
VEVAETGLEYDLRTKVPLYAAHGVREYWVINAKTLLTTVHRQPSGNSYAFTEELLSDALLVPTLASALAVSLNALDLD